MVARISNQDYQTLTNAAGPLNPKKVWIRGDLSVKKASSCEKFFWGIAKHSPWMQKAFYGLNLKKSEVALADLKAKIIQAENTTGTSSQNLRTLFNSSVDNFQAVSRINKPALAALKFTPVQERPPIQTTVERTAILAWGSLINQLQSPNYNDKKLEIEGNFEEASGLKLPIRMSRKSSNNDPEKRHLRRLTLVIDRNASDEKVYAASSKFRALEDAKKNLKEREGTSLTNIGYLKKGPASAGEETFYVNQKAWSGKKGSQLTTTKVEQIIQWAQNNNYSSVIWTGLPPNISTGQGTSGNRGGEILGELRNDPVLLRNTQEYIRLLPYTTALQRKILDNNLS